MYAIAVYLLHGRLVQPFPILCLIIVITVVLEAVVRQELVTRHRVHFLQQIALGVLVHRVLLLVNVRDIALYPLLLILLRRLPRQDLVLPSFHKDRHYILHRTTQPLLPIGSKALRIVGWHPINLLEALFPFVALALRAPSMILILVIVSVQAE